MIGDAGLMQEGDVLRWIAALMVGLSIFLIARQKQDLDRVKPKRRVAWGVLP